MKTAIRLACCALMIAVGACSNPDVSKQKYLDQGNAAFDKGKYAEAILAYRNAIKIDPLFGDARLKLAKAYEKSGDYGKAGLEYVRAADLLPQNADVQLTAAKYLLGGRQYEDARTRAKRAVDLDPKNAEAHIVLGTAVAGLKDLPSAMTEIESAISLNPHNAAGYTNKGALLTIQGRKDDAQNAFKEAVKIDPHSVEAWLALANFQWSTGATADAEVSIQSALKVDAKNVMANRAMALLYGSTGRAPAAEPYVKAMAAADGTPQAQLGLAQYYLQVGRGDQARPILEELSTNPKVSTAAKVRLAELDFASGNRDNAYKRIESALAQTPASAEALAAKARFLLVDNRVKEAQAPAEAATKADPNFIPGHFVLAQVQVRLGEVEKAKASYGEVIKLNPRAAAAQTALAALNLQSGRTDTAVQLARDATKTAPERSLDARLLLVRSLLAHRQVDEAGPEMAALLKLAPDHPAVRAMNGMFLLAKKDSASAQREFDRVLTRDPGNVDALAGLALLDNQSGQLARSRERVAKRLTVDPKNPAILMLAARLDVSGGDYATAEGRLLQVIDLTPASLQAYSMLGQVYLREKKLEQARQQFEALAARQSAPVAPYTLIGMILQMQNKPDEAIKAYQQALKFDPSAPVAANNVAYLYADRGENLEQALQLAQAAASRAPNEPMISDTVGWVYYKKQVPTLAVPEFEKSVQHAPTNALFQYHLGLAYAGTGDAQKARKALEEALRLDPSFDGAANARQTLASLKG